jgi:ketosteroid isomerase-like protein
LIDSPGGEIGRRKGLKIPWGQPRAGSSPAPGIISRTNLADGAWAALATPEGGSQEDRVELLQITERLAEAERRGDIQSLAELIADDYEGFGPDGNALHKAQIIAAYAQTVRLEELTLMDCRARVFGEAGIVTGRSRMRGKASDQPFSIQLRFTDTYAKRDGAWQLVASHVTSLSDEGSR